jgi:prefoldin alpha subunit
MSELSEKNKKLYVELKELDDQIKKLNSHLETLDEQLSDINTSKLVISKFTELKHGDELRVPLTSGIYIKAELKDTKKVMVNVGANVTVEKTPAEVTEILDTQINELNAFRESLVSNMKQLIARIEEIQKQFK